MTDGRPTIAVIGGTGALGSGLARRWALAGYPIVIGSRAADRAAEAASEIAKLGPSVKARGMENAAAAQAGDIVVVTVPFASQTATLTQIADAAAGKIVVDTTVPLAPPKVATVQLPAAGSAAAVARSIVGEKARLVAAFHNVAAHKLQKDEEIDCDVLVCGDDKDARETVVGLANAIGLRGIHAGPLANAVAMEAFTSILIGINKRYKVDGAGIRVTGIGVAGDLGQAAAATA